MQLNLTGGAGGTINVSEVTFGREFNEALVHQVVTAYLSGARAGTVQQKTRSEVRGGGKKPWKQKGTGRARAGSIRSPLWRGGGKTFAARPQDWSQKVNKKMYRGALCSILSELVRQDRLIIVDTFAVDAPKTKDLLAKLNTFGVQDVLIVTDIVDENLYLSARNLHTVGVCDPLAVDPVTLITFEKVIMTVAAVKAFEEMLA